MQTVRHQTICGTEQLLPHAGMKQKDPEIPVKMIGQPAGDRRLNSHRPMDGRERLITTPLQTWQAMQVGIGHELKILSA